MTKTVEDYRRESEERDREMQALLATLEVPAYTDRRLHAHLVGRKEQSGTYHAIISQDGTGAGCPQEVYDLLEEGDAYILETKGFNEIGGWIVNGEWYGHLSDQQIKRRHEESLEKMRREQAEFVEKNRDDWARREAELPDWAKRIMDKNRERSDDFDSEAMGWGYTLIAIELAVLYAELGDVVKNRDSFMGFEDPENIAAFHREQGTSGNQAGWAFAIARGHLRGELDS